MTRILLFILLLPNALTWGQTDTLNIRIDKNVENANDPDEKELIELWSAYLKSGEYKNPESRYWDTSIYETPDYFLWPIDVKNLKNRTPKVQCIVLGIFLVEQGHYALKTAIAHTNEKDEIVLEAIVSVYAKKVNGRYLLISSSQYHQAVWQKEHIGQITYYVHPNHSFNVEEADKMSAFNQKMADVFKVDPIPFDYFVSNYSREIVQLWGYEYMSKIYIPGQTGGVADINNRIVYAGNNSEYYPHELVHVYASEIFPDSYHFWLDEGFATFMGGSGGHDLDWHTEKLKEYVMENPNFQISFDTLKGYIPNGLHSTEFRYVIGGLICKKVYEAHGMEGVLEGLKTVNTDEELYQFIEQKLGIKEAKFSDYIKKIVK